MQNGLRGLTAVFVEIVLIIGRIDWHSIIIPYAGIAQLARASACQVEGRGFESRFPLKGMYGFSRE